MRVEWRAFSRGVGAYGEPTDRDRSAAIAESSFGSDLHSRSNVLPIRVGLLRQRREDIPILIEYVVKRFTTKMAERIRQIDAATA